MSRPIQVPTFGAVFTTFTSLFLVSALLGCSGHESPTDPTPTQTAPPTNNCVARDIVCAGSANDSVTSSSCVTSTGQHFNVHRLTTAAAATVTVTVTSRRYIVTMFLTDRNGNTITGAASVPPSDTARISRSLPADTYGIIVIPQANFLGDYSISIGCN